MNGTVMITGGSRGIGAKTVELFAERGYNVAFTYNKSDVAAIKLAETTHSLAIKADMSVQAEVVRAFAVAREKYGHINVLVNNAGISQTKLFTDITSDDWDRMFLVNTKSVYFACLECIPHMVSKKHGRIINISSVWGNVGASCEVHYSASKAAINGLTKALAKELAPSGISVNAIAPGAIDTDMNKGYTDAEREDISREIPLGSFGEAVDVARLALFLASEDASYITGQIIGCDGGFGII